MSQSLVETSSKSLAPSSSAAARHPWRFFRAGGFDQVRLDAGADLLQLENLDQKLWVALACPVSGLEFDTRTLQLIDADHDGRIRAPEILAAVKWACAMLKNPEDMVEGKSALPLDAINDATPEGKQVLSSARQILANLGSTATEITVEETADTAKIFAATRFNGDGIIPVDAADDAEVRAVLEEILKLSPELKDRSGKPGVDEKAVDAFFKDCETLALWHDAADPSVMILGDDTPAAANALASVAAKVDDYFARCRLASYDQRAVNALNRQESDYLAIAARDLTITSTEIAVLPLSRIAPAQPLGLNGNLNPAWQAAVQDLSRLAIKPLLGPRDSLAEEDWAQLKGRFAAYEKWLATRPETKVESLGIARVRQILAGPARKAIADLLAQDKALEPEATAIEQVERLVRYHRDLVQLLHNFVSFRDFYGRLDKAIFQAGTLYLDQRSCDLCIRVDDMARHAAMAHLSQTYLAYCDLTRRGDKSEKPEKMTIAAAFTAGDSDNLMVGRNGIFYDRHGNDWDATIVKIVDNPISIHQAFWAPYKRTIRWVEDQVAKRAAAADTASQARITKDIEKVMDDDQPGAAPAAAAAPPPPPTPAAPEPSRKIDVGVVAALGVAVGAITTALGIFLKWLTDTPAYFIPLYVALLMLAISFPSMVIAALKLRQRNLGPILDANGWAVNARARINIPFGRTLTKSRALPKGAKRNLRDPYAESHIGRNTALSILVGLAAVWALWYFGAIERVTPDVFPRSGWYDRHHQPSTQPSK